jgi:hypothetical protein
MLDHVIEIAVLEFQFLQSASELLDLIACQLMVDGRGSCLGLPRFRIRFS